MQELRAKRQCREQAWPGGFESSLGPTTPAAAHAQVRCLPARALPARRTSCRMCTAYAVPAASVALQEHQPAPPVQQHSQQPAREMVAEPALRKQGPEAQQLMREMLQDLGQAAAQRERADLREGAEAACSPPVQERGAQQQARVRKPHPGPAPDWAPASVFKGQAHRCGPADPCSAGAGGASSPVLESLREAAWQAAADQKAAAGALMAAWVSCGGLHRMAERRC